VYYKKKHTDRSVWDAALERTHEVYDRYDYVEVSFSGGKETQIRQRVGTTKHTKTQMTSSLTQIGAGVASSWAFALMNH